MAVFHKSSQTVFAIGVSAMSNEHYRQGDIECIDAIKSALTNEEFRGFCKGNILKYLWRERHKGGSEDLRKAQDYLKWATEAIIEVDEAE